MIAPYELHIYECVEQAGEQHNSVRGLPTHRVPTLANSMHETLQEQANKELATDDRSTRINYDNALSAHAFLAERTGHDNQEIEVRFIVDSEEQDDAYASVDMFTRTVNVYSDRLDNIDSAARQIAEASLVVHELAHLLPHRVLAIAYALRRPRKIQDRLLRSKSFARYDIKGVCLTGLLKHHARKHAVTAESFEEAFAEGWAVEYREKMYGETNKLWVEATNNNRSVWLPKKYVRADVEAMDHKGTTNGKSPILVVAPNLFTRALDVLDELSEEDLVALLRQSRSADNKSVNAQRCLARAINAVQPGLYKKFRDCPYTKDDAFELLWEIQRMYDDRKGTNRSSKEPSTFNVVNATAA